VGKGSVCTFLRRKTILRSILKKGRIFARQNPLTTLCLELQPSAAFSHPEKSCILEESTSISLLQALATPGQQSYAVSYPKFLVSRKVSIVQATPVIFHSTIDNHTKA